MLQNLRQGAIVYHKENEMEDLLYNILKFQGLSLSLSNLEMPFVECDVYMFVCTAVW